MKIKVGFATHGEVLQLLYNAFGVLPRKEDRLGDFKEKDKKTLQKQLSRLASEEGSLVENYEKALKDFCELLIQYLPMQGHAYALNALLEELNMIYANMIRAEGTYLDRHESIQYFISTRAVPSFVLAVQRSVLLYGSREAEELWIKDAFWYLPTIEASGKLQMPLAKVMRWAYESCGVSQKQFHCPGRPSDQTEPGRQQNLDNAVNWTRGKGIPSLPALMANFTDAFIAQSEHNRPVDPDLQKRILSALVFARVATFAAKEIDDAYGLTYLTDVCFQVRQMSQFLQEEVREFMRQVVPIMKTKTPETATHSWIKACSHHENFVRQKLSQVEALLIESLEEHPELPFCPELLRTLTRKFGIFAVHVNTDRLQRQVALKTPAGFVALFNFGFQIKDNPNSTLEQIDEFEAEVIKMKLQDTLGWLLAWLRGAYYYRRDDYVAAFQHYDAAFELAKYSAGACQYKLVNQFVELAAKTDKVTAFKRGIDWASYIGLEIRWLRDREPTSENLDFVRYMMKMANYAHQL